MMWVCLGEVVFLNEEPQSEGTEGGGFELVMGENCASSRWAQISLAASGLRKACSA